MTIDDLLAIIERHKKWLRCEKGGCCADLSGANLTCVNLSGANLSSADLSGADLSGANLCGADLHCADLSGAGLFGANLREADLRCVRLRGANLSGADLRWASLRGVDLLGADLSGADLSGADLRGANLCGAENLPDLSWTSIVPETGSFVGWKIVNGKEHGFAIIKLEILPDAKRCNATGRKCRCSAAKVLEIQKLDGTAYPVDSVTNYEYSPNIAYTVGETVLPDSFDEDRWNECSHGIHFFITRQEAVNY